MDKKIIALDLDGTLLNSDGIVTDVTKKHLKKLKEEGHIITIATGRILSRALVGTDGAEFANYIVCDAGAAVFKNEGKNKEWKEVYINPLTKDIVQSIASYYDKNKFITINICDRNKIHHYDKTIGIEWGTLLNGIEPVLSEKDKNAPVFGEHVANFKYED